mgnify:FL=1
MEQKRTDRLEFIKSLSDKGMNSVEISNYLNSNNIKSPKGLLYNPKLIWVTLNKYKKRLSRLNDYKIVYKSENLCVVSPKINLLDQHPNLFV